MKQEIISSIRRRQPYINAVLGILSIPISVIQPILSLLLLCVLLLVINIIIVYVSRRSQQESEKQFVIKLEEILDKLLEEWKREIWKMEEANNVLQFGILTYDDDVNFKFIASLGLDYRLEGHKFALQEGWAASLTSDNKRFGVLEFGKNKDNKLILGKTLDKFKLSEIRAMLYKGIYKKQLDMIGKNILCVVVILDSKQNETQIFNTKQQEILNLLDSYTSRLQTLLDREDLCN